MVHLLRISYLDPSSSASGQKHCPRLCFLVRVCWRKVNFYEAAHRDAAHQGQSDLPPTEFDDTGNHFVAFVKGTDGHLWELEGSRKGPLDRGILAENEDVLSEKALNVGVRRVMEINKGDEGGGDMRFSCIVLAPAL